jgi:hypothetical protein
VASEVADGLGQRVQAQHQHIVGLLGLGQRRQFGLVDRQLAEDGDCPRQVVGLQDHRARRDREELH